jgi:hypothetical protein
VKDPKHVDALSSLGAIGILQNDKQMMQTAENALRGAETTFRETKNVRQLLTELSRSQGKNIDDVSRAGIILNPSTAQNWINLAGARGHDAPVQFALKLARLDRTLGTEEVSMIYEKSKSFGDVQSGVLLAPWRIEGWQRLESFR